MCELRATPSKKLCDTSATARLMSVLLNDLDSVGESRSFSIMTAQDTRWATAQHFKNRSKNEKALQPRRNYNILFPFVYFPEQIIAQTNEHHFFPSAANVDRQNGLISRMVSRHFPHVLGDHADSSIISPGDRSCSVWHLPPPCRHSVT